MTQIKIYGASDDLIEVDGKAPGCDEYSPPYGADDCAGTVVCQPTGDRFHVVYGADGRAVWKVVHENVSGRLAVSIVEAPPGDEPDPYTDVATVEGEIASVRFWKIWPPSTDEIRDRIATRMEDPMPDDMVRRVWEALGTP